MSVLTFIRSVYPKILEGSHMPQRVLCKECGAILYEGIELKTPDEVIQANNGKCPKCGRKLSLIPHKIEILPFKKPKRALR